MEASFTYRRLVSVVFLFYQLPLSISSSGAPWQETGASTASKVLEDAIHGALPPTIFAHSGRLPVVEAALEGVSEGPTNNLVVALQCKEGCVVVSTARPASPYLYRGDPKSTINTTTTETSSNYTSSENTTVSENGNATKATSPPLLLSQQRHGTRIPAPFCQLASSLWGVTAGNAVDSQHVRRMLQSTAEAEISGDDDDLLFATPLAAATIARQVADGRQWVTQQQQRQHPKSTAGSNRLWHCSLLLFESDGPIWRVDPTGAFYPCRAAVIGHGMGHAEIDLLELLTAQGTDAANDSSTKKGTTLARLSRETLQRVVSELSMDEALDIAVETIRLAARRQSPSKTVQPVPELVALSIDRSNTVQVFGPKELEEIASRRGNYT